MARVKVTSSDINAKLARGECANYRNNGCQGRTPCTVVNGEPCTYFNTYVKPLLDYPDFAAKYGREAKISVALNPKSKVIRKRRKADEPALKLTAGPPLPNPAPPAAAPAKKSPKPVEPTEELKLEPPASMPAKRTRSNGKAADAEKPVPEPIAARPTPPPAPAATKAKTVIEPAVVATSKRGNGSAAATPKAPEVKAKAKSAPEPEQAQLFGDLFPTAGSARAKKR